LAFFSLNRLLGLNEGDSRQFRRQAPFRPSLEVLENRLALSTLHVGPSTGEFHTIQSAVTGAHTGDKILVDPGTYQEQVTFPAAEHDIKLVSTSPLAAVIKAPAAMTGSKAIVDVMGAKDVTIDGFTITGPGGGPSDSIRYGIRIDSGGSATIIGNHITQIKDTPLSVSQTGIAILVGHQDEATTGNATIVHNTIDNYQKGAIQISNVGSCAEIEDNTIVGVGPTDIIAQNGIQVDGGANAEISENVISGNIYTPQTFASSGILLFNPGAVTVDHNTLSQNDVGIWVIGATGTEIDHNQVSGSAFNGIILDTTTRANVRYNQTNNNGSGFHDSLSGFSDGGIALYNSSKNTIDHNTSKNNQGDGIFVDSLSTNNMFRDNQMTGNTIFDAEDLSVGGRTAGTANRWKNNQCNSDNKGGAICGPHDDHDGKDD
jgi:parallel beta-helix repeat protein